MLTYTTQEAQLQEKSQKNSSRVTAILISSFIYGLLFLALIFWGITSVMEPEPNIIVQAPQGEVKQEVEMKDFTNNVSEKPSSSGAQMASLITANTAAEVTVPEVVEMFEETIDLGTGTGVAGFGSAGMGGGGGIPAGSPISDRCSAKDRKKRLREGGGDQSTEDAVVKALDYFKDRQNENGSWGGQRSTAMTGLVLLAYLGHCETPDSRKYGMTVTKGLTFLINQSLENHGRLRTDDERHWVYEHAIATYALCEAFSMIKHGRRQVPKLKEACLASVPLIIGGQNETGGFDYEFNSGRRGDLSITGWMFQALKAASLTGLEFDGMKKCVRNMTDYVIEMHGKKGFGYVSPGDKYTLTGVGCLCLQMGGRGNRSEVRKGISYIAEHELKFDTDDASAYAWYYNTQAMFQHGGSHWKEWNKMMKPELVAKQKGDGAWPDEGGDADAASSKAAGNDAELYRTALFTLMLEVYYRYLPATK